MGFGKGGRAGFQVEMTHGVWARDWMAPLTEWKWTILDIAGTITLKDQSPISGRTLYTVCEESFGCRVIPHRRMEKKMESLTIENFWIPRQGESANRERKGLVGPYAI